MVSAEWHPVPLRETVGSTVVHSARSDTFHIPLTEPRGAIKVWLIYADFLDTSVSSRWPREQEDAGGILAFFTAEWSPNDGKIDLSMAHSAPPSSTGFDWPPWKREGAMSVLTLKGR